MELARWHSSDGDGQKMEFKCSNLEKKKEKKNGLKAKVSLIGPFCFSNQDAIECVIGFRIDSRTIKRGTLTVITVI